MAFSGDRRTRISRSLTVLNLPERVTCASHSRCSINHSRWIIRALIRDVTSWRKSDVRENEIGDVRNEYNGTWFVA